MSVSSSNVTPGRRLVTGLVVAVGLVSGAWLNIDRQARWTPIAISDGRSGSVPAAETMVETAGRALRSFGRVRVSAPEWRPLELTLDLGALSGGTASETDVRFMVDDREIGVARVGRTWTQPVFVVRASPPFDETLTLSWNFDPGAADHFTLRGIRARPVRSVWAVTRYAAAGAIVGAMLCLLWHPRTWRWLRAQPPRTASVPGPVAPTPRRVDRDAPTQPVTASRGTLACVGAGIFLWFLVWGVAKPIFQVPDEPQHLMRAEALLRAPWVAPQSTFAHDPRFLNPLALWHPPAIWKVIPRVTQPLTVADLAALKQQRWLAPDATPALDPYRIAVASYPPAYYWTVFALGEPVTRVFALSPYQSVWAYRVMSAIGASLLWLAVYIALRQLPETSSLAPVLLAAMVLNPMVGYLSAAVTADAFSIPLGVLAMLLAWRTVSTGTGAGLTVAALMAGLLVKPSGAQIIVSICVATLIVWLVGRVRRPDDGAANVRAADVRVTRVRGRDASRVVVAAAMTGVAAYAAFYAWSPPRIFGTPKPTLLATYVFDLPGRFMALWTGAWGLLGWADVRLADGWYLALLGVILIGAACTLLRPATPPAPLIFFATASAVFIATTLFGEYRYLERASYFLQGRYFLPALAGLLPVLLHRVRPARLALLALLVLMNGLLIAENIHRCYADWHALWASLPFVS